MLVWALFTLVLRVLLPVWLRDKEVMCVTAYSDQEAALDFEVRSDCF